MKIGIIGAMKEEVDLIRSDLMKDISEKAVGGRTYYEGLINNIPVVLVFSRWGKVASSISTTTLINTFQVDQVIFTGVAGAASPELEIGDIVISSECYQHDMDARPLFKRNEIPLIGKTYLEADRLLISQSNQACTELALNISSVIDNKEFLKEFSISKPACLIGLIASGDQFIGSDEKIYELLKHQPKTLAVEMEGASVAQVCFEHDIPFVIIRIISDKANSSAAIDFPKFVSKVASFYSKYIVNSIFHQRSSMQQEIEGTKNDPRITCCPS
jgi:adenosylhomocysteine nucleosidase